MPYDKDRKDRRYSNRQGVPRAVRDDDPRGGYKSNDRYDNRGYKGNDRSDNRGGYRSNDRYDSRGGYKSNDRSDNRGGYRGSDRSDNRGGYKPNDRYDNRGGYKPNDRSDNRSGYKSNDRHDSRGGYRSDRSGFKSDDRFSPRPPQREPKPEPRRYAHLSPFDDPQADPLTRYMAQPAPQESESAEPENMLVGRNPIREAIKAGRDIEKLMVARGDLSGSAREIIARAHEAGIIVQEVDRTRLDALYKGHQGMIAFASAANYAELDDILEEASAREEDPFVIVLDGITDPHNLGAIIRTAECVGAHGVIIPQRRGVGLTPAAVKASAGACEYVKVARVTNIHRALDTLKAHGMWVIGAAMDGEDALSSDLSGPVALVIGAEGEGLSELTEKKCDMRLKLPMKGHIDSLNASVAAGVMMYAVLSARRG